MCTPLYSDNSFPTYTDNLANQASCRDCLSYLASIETVCDLLLPAETTVHEKWLPAETVPVILLPAETLGRKLIHTKHNSLGRKQEVTDSLTRTVSAGSYLPSTTVLAGSKRSLTVSAEAKYDGQSLQEAKISGLVYTLWISYVQGGCILTIGSSVS